MISFVIAGLPARGKSTSLFPNEELGIKGLPPQEMFYITCAGDGKRMLLPNWREVLKVNEADPTQGQYLATTNTEYIRRAVLKIAKERPEIRYIVIEDANLSMGKTVLNKKMERDDWAKLGYDGWTLFSLVDLIKTQVNREDLFLIYTMHLRRVESDGITFKTRYEFNIPGQSLQKNVPLEGLWDIVMVANLRYNAQTKTTEYVFETKPFDDTPARSPFGMFPREGVIPNDCGLVVDYICKYDGIKLSSNSNSKSI